MRRRERERAGRFVAEGEDLLAAADAAGWRAVERFCAAGSGLPGIEVEPKLLASASGLGSGTRTLAVYEERWAPAPIGSALRLSIRGPRPRQRRRRAALGRGVRGLVRGDRPRQRRSVRPEGGPGEHGRRVRGAPVAGARRRSVDQLAGHENRPRCRHRARRWPERARPDQTAITLLIGAERDGLPQHVIDAADLTAQIPIRSHSLNAAMAATVALYEVNRMAPAT